MDKDIKKLLDSINDINPLATYLNDSALSYVDKWIDTGSLKGRPFRLGSTMIIKLPKRFEQYKSILESELQKHISSGDYPILIFEN